MEVHKGQGGVGRWGNEFMINANVESINFQIILKYEIKGYK